MRLARNSCQQFDERGFQGLMLRGLIFVVKVGITAASPTLLTLEITFKYLRTITILTNLSLPINHLHLPRFLDATSHSNRNRKEHLISIRTKGYDSNHPQNDNVWSDQNVQKLLVVKSRSTELTKMERTVMKNSKYYQNHRAMKLQRIKTRQQAIKFAATVVKGTLAGELSEATTYLDEFL